MSNLPTGEKPESSLRQVGKATGILFVGWALGVFIFIVCITSYGMYQFMQAIQPHPVEATNGVSFGMEPMSIKVWASANRASPGDRIHLRATLTNDSSQSQVFDLGSRPVFDLVIQQGNQIARWTEGKPMTPERTRLELGHGESRVIEMDWVAGQYAMIYASAEFDCNSPGGPIESSISICVSNCVSILP